MVLWLCFMSRLWLFVGLLVLASCSMPQRAEPTVVHDPSLVFTDVARCAEEGPRRQVCYDDFIQRYAGDKTTRQLLAELLAAMHVNENVNNACHSVAHAIGRLNYERAGNAQDALAQCDFTCFSGCLHGSVERMFFTEEQMAAGEEHPDLENVKAAIPRLCLEQEMPDTTQHTLDQCVHGAGHALMFALEYDMAQAFSLCDLFPEEKRYTCYTGVAMENISASDTRRRHLNPDNVLFPCDTLEGPTASACWYYQPTYMMERGMTMEQISERCLSVGALAGDCIEGYSREFDLIFIRKGHPEHAVRFCEELSGEHAQRCIDSTVRSSVIAFNDGSSAYAFCSALNIPEHRTFCIRSAVGYFQGKLQWSREQLRADCHNFAGPENDICSQALSIYDSL